MGRLAQRLARVRRWIRGKWFDWKNRDFRHMEGWCMCGDKIDSHDWVAGHGPVDQWHYYRDEYVHRESSIARALKIICRGK